jgi:outer membrane receptor protein involved in Fe transport
MKINASNTVSRCNVTSLGILTRAPKTFSMCSVGAWASVAAVLAWSSLAAAQLEEVVVTAQKRDQNLQEIPLAVSAFSGDDARQVGANNIERLDALTPGMEWGSLDWVRECR